jgi:hypothetical protein
LLPRERLTEQASVIGDYESPRGREQLAADVLAVRPDFGKNGHQAIKEMNS